MTERVTKRAPKRASNALSQTPGGGQLTDADHLRQLTVDCKVEIDKAMTRRMKFLGEELMSSPNDQERYDLADSIAKCVWIKKALSGS